MEHAFPFVGMDLEDKLEKATEGHRRDFLLWMAKEPNDQKEAEERPKEGTG